jgi:hypothetical protein
MPPEAISCTYCAADKRRDLEPLPAIARYRSDRIAALHAAGPMLILSGEYGLLAPEDPIPWYDHLLMPEEVEELVPQVISQLRSRSITALDFHTADPLHTPAVRPYVAVITQACAAAGVALRLVLLSSDQD